MYVRKSSVTLEGKAARSERKHPLLLWIGVILTGLLLLLLLPLLAPSPAPKGLPREVNVNNLKSPQYGGQFFALDGQFYYLQDGFYNMGVYRSTGSAARRIFQSSDFSTRDGEQYGRLGDIFPVGDLLYFELYADGGRSNFYLFDPAENSFRYLFHSERVSNWFVREPYLVYQKESDREKETLAFQYDELWVYDLSSGRQSRIADNVEQIGLVDGTLFYVSFEGECRREPDESRENGYRLVYDGEYSLSSYDFQQQRSTELGRFPLIFEPEEYYSQYEFFSFTDHSVAMYTFHTPYACKLVLYTPGQELLVITTPLPIHKLVAAGDVAYALLYDEQRPDPQQGLYRFDLKNGSFEKLGQGLPCGNRVELYVASEDAVFLVTGHPWLIGTWRNVLQIDPQSGAILRRYQI